MCGKKLLITETLPPAAAANTPKTTKNLQNILSTRSSRLCLEDDWLEDDDTAEAESAVAVATFSLSVYDRNCSDGKMYTIDEPIKEPMNPITKPALEMTIDAKLKINSKTFVVFFSSDRVGSCPVRSFQSSNNSPRQADIRNGNPPTTETPVKNLQTVAPTSNVE